MGQFSRLLTVGETHMQTMIPNTFTVDGIDGEFAYIAESGRYQIENTTAGQRGNDSITIGFLLNDTYSPSVGDRLTIDESVWVVEQVRTGEVKHELTLISDDE